MLISQTAFSDTVALRTWILSNKYTNTHPSSHSNEQNKFRSCSFAVLHFLRDQDCVTLQDQDQDQDFWSSKAKIKTKTVSVQVQVQDEDWRRTKTNCSPRAKPRPRLGRTDAKARLTSKIESNLHFTHWLWERHNSQKFLMYFRTRTFQSEHSYLIFKIFYVSTCIEGTYVPRSFVEHGTSIHRRMSQTEQIMRVRFDETKNGALKIEVGVRIYSVRYICANINA